MPQRLIALSLAVVLACGLGLSLPVLPAKTAPEAQERVLDLALPGFVDTLLIGATEKDQLGNDLRMGDLNADGLVDLVAGAHWGTASGRNIVGRSYVVFGRREWGSLLDLGQAAYQDWSFMGSGHEARLGSAVAAGDLNGDRIDDLAMGALLADPGNRANAGAVYLMFGGPAVGGRWDYREKEPDAFIAGASTPQGSDQLGTDLAIGDFNADGRSDLAVASVYRASRTGAVFVWWGPIVRGEQIFLDSRAADWTITGSVENGLFSAALAAGNLTGDGIDDLVASASSLRGAASASGGVYVFPGGRGNGGRVDLATASAPIELTGRKNMNLGVAVSPGTCSCRGLVLNISDITGDGKPDLIAGTPLDRGRLGGAVVVAGPLAPGRHDLATTPHLAIAGVLPDGRLGWSLATGGLDGDGRADLVLAAPWADVPEGEDPDGRADAGAVYGLRGPLPAVGELAIDGAPLLIYGPEAGSGNASITTVLADTDGDGTDDLHLGFPDADPQRRQSVGLITIQRGPLLDTLATATPTRTPSATPTATFTASATPTDTPVPPPATDTPVPPSPTATPNLPSATTTRATPARTGTPASPTATRRATATRGTSTRIVDRAYLPLLFRARVRPH